MNKILVFLALSFSVHAFAGLEGDQKTIAECLAIWKTHPFGKDPSFKTIGTTTKVLGFGSDPVKDTEKTDKPSLVLIRPGTTVLAKNTYDLLNPNGWYCLKGNVSVLGKTQINLHCDAHITSSRAEVNVLGANENNGGVTVLGTIRIERKDCPASRVIF